jgi:hypothetical protein
MIKAPFEAVRIDPGHLPGWFTPEMQQALNRLLNKNPEANLTLYEIGREMVRLDPFYQLDTEMGFLSALLAGGECPAGVTEVLFLVPWHKLIFNAITQLREMRMWKKTETYHYNIGPENIELLKKFLDGLGLLERAGGAEFVNRLERVVGIPSAAPGLAIALFELAFQRSGK